MSVSLRIVGIYYNQSDIPFKENMTVMDVLNYARLTQAITLKFLVLKPDNYKLGRILENPVSHHSTVNIMNHFKARPLAL